jgi:hypothetical protein
VHLVERVNPFNAAFGSLADALSSRLGGDQNAYAAVYREVLREAQTLAYVDTYWLLAAAGTLMLALSWLLKKNPLGAAAEIRAE